MKSRSLTPTSTISLYRGPRPDTIVLDSFLVVNHVLDGSLEVAIAPVSYFLHSFGETTYWILRLFTFGLEKPFCASRFKMALVMPRDRPMILAKSRW